MADGWDLFGGAPGATAAPAPASTQAAPQSAGWELFGGEPNRDAPTTTPAPAPDATPVDTNPRHRQAGLTPAEAQALTGGINRAVDDVVSAPASWLARGADALGLTSGQGAKVDATNAARRAAYDAQYGNVPLAELGRTAGQVALTLPLAGGVGRLAGAGADLLASGAGRVSPLLGTVVSGVGDFLAGNAGGAGVLPRAVQGGSVVANSALQGATSAALTAGQSDTPLQNQLLQGAGVGAIAGPVARGMAAGVGSAGKALVGGDMNPEVAALARTARDKYGIQLTGDMISPSPFVKTLGSQLEQVPMTGMAPAKEEARRQFTKAVAGTLGEDADYVTPAVMERAKTRIGGVMNDAAARTGVPVDQTLANDLQDIARSSMGAMPASERPLLKRQISDVLNMAKNNGGTIPGEGYQTLTGHRSDIATTLRSGSPIMKEFSGRLKDALDSALERGAIASGNTSAIDALKQARLQYKNLKTIEPLVTKGEPGEVTPNRLLGVVDRSFKGRALRANQPDLGELADIGQRFNLVPDSGTARRTAALAAMGTLGSAATQLASGQPENALMTAAAIPAAMVGGRVASAYLRSPGYINSLLNRTALAPAAQVNPLLQGRLTVPLSVIEQGRLMGR